MEIFLYFPTTNIFRTLIRCNECGIGLFKINVMNKIFIWNIVYIEDFSIILPQNTLIT